MMGRYSARPGQETRRRRRHRGSLQAARPVRCVPREPSCHRGGARRQARHAGRLLGHRREADRLEGSFALRRAALGVIRIVLENERDRLSLLKLRAHCGNDQSGRSQPEPAHLFRRPPQGLSREQARHDLIDAVFPLPGQDDLLMIVPRQGAGEIPRHRGRRAIFYRHQARLNILPIEEKKDGEELRPSS